MAAASNRSDFRVSEEILTAGLADATFRVTCPKWSLDASELVVREVDGASDLIGIYALDRGGALGRTESQLAKAARDVGQQIRGGLQSSGLLPEKLDTEPVMEFKEDCGDVLYRITVPKLFVHETVPPSSLQPLFRIALANELANTLSDVTDQVPGFAGSSGKWSERNDGAAVALQIFSGEENPLDVDTSDEARFSRGRQFLAGRTDHVRGLSSVRQELQSLVDHVGLRSEVTLVPTTVPIDHWKTIHAVISIDGVPFETVQAGTNKLNNLLVARRALHHLLPAFMIGLFDDSPKFSTNSITDNSYIVVSPQGDSLGQVCLRPINLRTPGDIEIEVITSDAKLHTDLVHACGARGITLSPGGRECLVVKLDRGNRTNVHACTLRGTAQLTHSAFDL